MIIIFWAQIIMSVLVSVLEGVNRFMGIPIDVGFSRYNWAMFLVSGGFLLIHNAIVAQKVKP